MERRRAGVALALAGLAAFGVLLALGDAPADLEQWACCGDDGGRLMGARGPAVARYDPALDATFAAFRCAHGYCPFAVRIAGDATAEVSRDQVLLRSPESPAPRSVRAMAEPLAVDEMGRERVVGNATVATFRLASRWPPILRLDAAFLAAGAGLLLAWGFPPRAVAAALAGGAAGLALGLRIVATLYAGAFYAVPLALLLLAAAGLTFLLSRRVPAARTATAALVLAAAGLVFAALTQDAFHPQPPAL